MNLPSVARPTSLVYTLVYRGCCGPCLPFHFDFSQNFILPLQMGFPLFGSNHIVLARLFYWSEIGMTVMVVDHRHHADAQMTKRWRQLGGRKKAGCPRGARVSTAAGQVCLKRARWHWAKQAHLAYWICHLGHSYLRCGLLGKELPLKLIFCPF